MMNVKKYVEYLDNIFAENYKDINGTKNAVEMFFNFFERNNEVINNDVTWMLKEINDKINSEESEIDKTFVNILAGTFLGMILGKYSRQFDIKNYEI